MICIYRLDIREFGKGPVPSCNFGLVEMHRVITTQALEILKAAVLSKEFVPNGVDLFQRNLRDRRNRAFKFVHLSTRALEGYWNFSV